ncbi:MAG: DNA helicase [Sulfobacillus benefaciens]|uniref:DNA helicase n=1 Tax=Sulfobacillus benefaciens TaxID=453960 RepID=A0A2T2XJ20_9FIRM|nr:MAG: DNA helicase [Sulfobacillus benefaciens]
MTDPRLVTHNLAQVLQTQLAQSRAAYWLVAFTMASGVEILLPHLKMAMEHGTDVKILTGDYLYVTEPEALALLLEEMPTAEIRIWMSQGQSFHAKSYLFEHQVGDYTSIVGSSNWSRSALTGGVEWNLMVRGSDLDSINRFMHMFYADRTVPLNRVTLTRYQEEREQFRASSPDWIREWTRAESARVMIEGWWEDLLPDYGPLTAHGATRLMPRPAQVEALKALQATQAEGYQKALVVLPTGLGKTYLAAFFAKAFQRILFVAHREEILNQALQSFQQVLPQRRIAKYRGKPEDLHADGLFASVYTLAGAAHRNRFNPSDFDLVIIDEFHHAAASSYQKILQHFRPKFLLGLTATPDRTDGRDIFGLCEGNLAYRLTLPEAINRQWLAPFWYYGVYDPIDYTSIRWRQTHYDEEELLRMQTQSSHAEVVYRAWQTHHLTKTLGFCSSVRHAQFLSEIFQQKGIRSAWVDGESGMARRRQIIRDLERGELDIVFSVDLFNEGIDIPVVDTILLVRPTQSSIVFIQQLGRGLRLSSGKSHCVVIDLIGNYRNADAKLEWLGVSIPSAAAANAFTAVRASLPQACRMDLAIEVIDVLTRMIRQRTPRKTWVLNAYHQLKTEWGRRPTYLEFHLHSGVDSRLVRQEFGSFVGVLEAADDLSPHDQEIWSRYHDWISEVEKTPMVKSYKMVLLQAMLNRGPKTWWESITPTEAAPYFHRYLTSMEYRKRIDFSDKATRALWDYRESKMASLIRRMPMSQWSSSSAGWVTLDAEGFQVRLTARDEGVLTTLYEWTREIAEYRLHWYFERKERSQGSFTSD